MDEKPVSEVCELMYGDEPDLNTLLFRSRLLIAIIKMRDAQWVEGGDPMKGKRGGEERNRAA